MKLTALEIKQQKFDKSLRGYDPAEVQAFLNLMSNEWEHLVTKNRELEQQIEDLKDKLEHYERVEEALHETLQAAKESAETKLVGARKEADNTIDKAEMEAEKIVRNAKQERQEVRRGIRRLLDRRKEIIAGIRSYLEVAQESVDQFSKDDARLFDVSPEMESARDEIGANSGDKENRARRSSETSTDATNTSPTPPGTEDIDELVDDLD